VKYVMALEGSI